MKGQKIEEISISDMVLWTENPRDRIDPGADNQAILNMSLTGRSNKWKLKSLANKMGEYYDFSEIPTIVYHDNSPVVYDGNRRVILGLLSLGILKPPSPLNFTLPAYPDYIPCNVCPKETALENVYRKHAETGSWDPLERDIFLHRHMGEEKSDFLVINDSTGLIDQYGELNAGFVKDEVLSRNTLGKLGFWVKNGELYTCHSDSDATRILGSVARLVIEKEITTRKNRGKTIERLPPEEIERVKKADFGRRRRLSSRHAKKNLSQVTPSRTRRTKKDGHEIFGRPLILKRGQVNDLYRDICDLFGYYSNRRTSLSKGFPALLRMAMRLIVDTARSDFQLDKIDDYVNQFFRKGKKCLSTDEKTLLHAHNVNESTLVNLLHIGAHSYSNARNFDQTIAISLIVGQMLQASHGRELK